MGTGVPPPPSPATGDGKVPTCSSSSRLLGPWACRSRRSAWSRFVPSLCSVGTIPWWCSCFLFTLNRRRACFHSVPPTVCPPPLSSRLVSRGSFQKDSGDRAPGVTAYLKVAWCWRDSHLWFAFFPEEFGDSSSVVCNTELFLWCQPVSFEVTLSCFLFLSGLAVPSAWILESRC